MEDLSDHPADRAANPVVGISWDDPGPRHIPTHSHRRGQMIYAERGCVTVEAHGASFILPPHRAAWVPPETPHADGAADVAGRPRCAGSDRHAGAEIQPRRRAAAKLLG